MTRKSAVTAPRKSAAKPVANDPLRPPVATLANVETAPVASHVHELHDFLASKFVQPEAPKWSARATLGFVILVCGGFWVSAFVAIKLIIR